MDQPVNHGMLLRSGLRLAGRSAPHIRAAINAANNENRLVHLLGNFSWRNRLLYLLLSGGFITQSLFRSLYDRIFNVDELVRQGFITAAAVEHTIETYPQVFAVQTTRKLLKRSVDAVVNYLGSSTDEPPKKVARYTDPVCPPQAHYTATLVFGDREKSELSGRSLFSSQFLITQPRIVSMPIRRSRKSYRRARSSVKRLPKYLKGYARLSSRLGSKYRSKVSKPEMKKKFVSWAGTSINTTGIATELTSAIAQGTAYDERIGRKIKLHSIDLRGHFTYTPTAITDGDANVRVVLVLDKQTNGALYTAGSLFHDTAHTFYTHFNVENNQRFTILYDKVFRLPIENENTAAGTPGSVEKPFHIRKKLNHVLEFDTSVAGTIADLKSNSLSMYTVSGTNGSGKIVKDMEMQLEFSDP